MDVLARSAEEAEQKAFDAATASLLEGPEGFQFDDEVDWSEERETGSGDSAAAIEEGPTGFEQRGL